MRCGLQAPGRTGALFPSSGRVADADQAVVFDAGTCLGLVGKEVSDPVACGETHAAEVAGVVDLGTQFRDAFPSVDDQDNYLQPTCQRIAEQYVGSAQKLTDSKLTVYWTNLAAGVLDRGHPARDLQPRLAAGRQLRASPRSPARPRTASRSAGRPPRRRRACVPARRRRCRAPRRRPRRASGTATGGTAGGAGQETGGQQPAPGLPVPSLPVPGLGGG